MMYREGRHVHKNTRQPAKHIRKKTTVFWSKIYEFSMKKLVAAAFTANIENIAVVGPPFSGKTRFFCKFGGPWGDPKIVKTGRAFRQKTVESNEPFKNSTFFDLGVAS